MARLLVLLAALAAVALLAGGAARDRGGDGAQPGTAGAEAPGAQARAPAPQAARPRRARLRRLRCPSALDGCRSVRGRVVLVERVDPDGDGDLHVVVAAGAVTLPGLTSVDVAPALRPRRDPRVGDLVSAAGQVQTGSYGQAQIHAARFAVARERAR